MASSSSSGDSGNFGLAGILQIIFLVLKLATLVDWSWTMVLMPLWISIGWTIFKVLLILIIYFFDD
jgi:hypothetical protein